jgi:hypothetical protein
MMSDESRRCGAMLPSAPPIRRFFRGNCRGRMLSRVYQISIAPAREERAIGGETIGAFTILTAVAEHG